eukprot:10016467-Alexandrium_andersonii.AAC.1
MHQFCISVVTIFKGAGLMSAMFCAAILLHRKRAQTKLRAKLRRHLGEHARCRFAPPDPRDVEHARALVRLPSSLPSL